MSEKVQPPQPPKPSATKTPVFYEKHYDPTYQRHYYYDPASGDSVWEVPEGSIIADMTLDNLHQNVQASSTLQ